MNYVGTITIGYPPKAAARTQTLQEVIEDALNYEVWSELMKTTLTDQGLWDVVENGIPPDPSKSPNFAEILIVEVLCKWREFVKKDMKALEILQSSLPDSVFRKTLSATTAKQLWDMMEPVPDRVSLDWTYDEDVWMVHTNTSTTNHMTPHFRFFTTLDRTRKAKVKFNDGNSVTAQGTGDVRILTREGKVKTFVDVLYVPGIVNSVLSVDQLYEKGYTIKMGAELITIRDRATGTLFGEARWVDGRGGFFLRL